MALGAGQRRGVDLLEVAAHGVGQILVGHHQGAAGVAVAVVAAQGLVDLLQHVLKSLGIGLVAELVGQHGHVRGLAGEAVCHRVRTAGARHVVDDIGVAAGAAVELGEAVALEQRGDHGILRHIVLGGVVLAVLHVGRVDFGVSALPVLRGQHRDAGAGLLDLGDAHTVRGYFIGRRRGDGERPLREHGG